MTEARSFEPRIDLLELAQDVLKGLRGRRSQAQLSTRLGYQSNVIHAWELGRSLPTAAAFFALARVCGVAHGQALRRFFGKVPAPLDGSDLATPHGVTNLLSVLRGDQPLKDLVQRVGRNRFALARWFAGKAEPRLDDFFRLIDACTLRLPDFVAAIVDPTGLPHLREHWQLLQSARQAAHDHPWSHAVLRVLELEAYQRLPKHAPAWIAARLGLSQNQVEEYVALLHHSGQIRWQNERWLVEPVQTIDLRDNATAARQTAAFWARQGFERLETQGLGNFAYNVFAVSNGDMARLQELQREYFAKVRQIIASSEPVEQVAVMNLQLFPLVVEPTR